MCHALIISIYLKCVQEKDNSHNYNREYKSRKKFRKDRNFKLHLYYDITIIIILIELYIDR